jgi:putative ABC transport system substrate-binding protein
VQGRNLKLSFHLVGPLSKSYEDTIVSLLPNVDILVVWSTVGAVAAKKVAGNVPTVFLSVGAPVNVGIVESLARPGGNMTGVTFEAADDTYGKRLQLLRELVPGISRVAVLRAAADANATFAMASLERTAPALGMTLLPVEIKSLDELENAFTTMAATNAQGLLVVAGTITLYGARQIAELTLRHKIPSCHTFRETVAAGGLVSLGADLVAMTRQGASYIGKIIQGAKPADLPVEQPARYELHINLKTAKALAITVPPALLARADELIE